MVSRIYILAKDLGLDNKTLIEICESLGIHGKGSALASMTDEEVHRVREHLSQPLPSFEDYIKRQRTHVRWPGRGLSILPSSLINLNEIIELDLSSNKIGLSEESLNRIAKLTSLVTLILADNSIGVLPDSFGDLVNLEVLDLSGNRLSYLPKSLANLRRLSSIKLGGNRFSELPSALSGQINLTCLDAPNNQLTSIPSWIGQFQKLTQLNLSQNKLGAIPTEVSKLTNLVELRVDRNSILELPTLAAHRQSLTILTASENALIAFPDGLSRCIKLEQVDLGNNQIREIPSEIDELSNLRILRLSGNEISTLPDSIGNLKSLHTLDVSSNAVKWLPITLRQLLAPTGALTILSVHDNPKLNIPPEILGNKNTFASEPKHSAESILEFYFRRQSGPRRKLREAKVLLVGQGGVGKSSIAKQLLNPTTKFDPGETQTNGISILKWSIDEPFQTPDPTKLAEVTSKQKLSKRQQKRQRQRINMAKQARDFEIARRKQYPPVRVNVWDFGGQEIMHSTHQFFLTERSLYLLVLDARSGEHEGNLHGWLKTIRGFGGVSPVVIVVNKCEPPHHLQLDETRLKLDYGPNLVGIYYVSCESSKGIDELRAAVMRQVLDLPHINDELPETYFDVKSELELRSEREDFITEKNYKEVCRENHIHETDSQRVLLQFLHDLGSVLHYDDPRQHYLIYDTNVLNPEWVTNGVYKVLMNHELRANGDGKVHLGDLERLLGDSSRYPRERHRFLIDLMRKFDLCFALDQDSGQLLVPELLSPNEPDIGWDIGECLNFQFHYSVLPRGLLPRFIVRTHHLLTKRPTYWRYGVVLEIEGCRIAVRGDVRTAVVYIQVQQRDVSTRRRALAVVRDHFGAIHTSMPKLEVKAKIPLPGESNAPPVEFAHLCRLEEKGEDLYWFEGSDKQWSIRELLGGTIDREFDVFLCHNSLDKPAVKTLAGLLRERAIRAWLDVDELTPGKPWQAEVADAVSACRSIAVIIGPSGAGIWQLEEVRLALSEAAAFQKDVIPVVLPGSNPTSRDLPPEFRYLNQRTWVVFEREFEEENIRKLCKGIRN